MLFLPSLTLHLSLKKGTRSQASSSDEVYFVMPQEKERQRFSCLLLLHLSPLRIFIVFPSSLLCVSPLSCEKRKQIDTLFISHLVILATVAAILNHYHHHHFHLSSFHQLFHFQNHQVLDTTTTHGESNERHMNHHHHKRTLSHSLLSSL